MKLRVSYLEEDDRGEEAASGAMTHFDARIVDCALENFMVLVAFDNGADMQFDPYSLDQDAWINAAIFKNY